MKPARPLHPYILVLPHLLFIFFFIALPLLLALRTSLYSWDLLRPEKFVGLDNYASLIDSSELSELLGRTCFFSSVVVIGSTAMGLGTALLLNRNGLLYAIARGVIFSAYVVSWVAVALLWMWMLDGDAGILARTCRALGLIPKAWLSDPQTALLALAVITVWKLSGYSMVLFTAGLQDIPSSVLEAALLDGSSKWTRFCFVTLPLLRPTITFVAITSLVAAFQAFDVMRIITQGGPVRSTTTMMYAIFEDVFVNLRIGRASALAVILFLFLLGITWLQWRLGTTSRVARGERA